MTYEELHAHPILDPKLAPKDYCYANRGGVECERGWLPLLWDMAQKITALYDEAEKPVDLRILQIKQKFGGLRIYYDFGEGTRGPVMDFLGAGMSFTFPGERPINDELHKKIESIIEQACEAANKTCEHCGSTDDSVKLRTGERKWWIKTYCDICQKVDDDYRRMVLEKNKRGQE